MAKLVLSIIILILLAWLILFFTRQRIPMQINFRDIKLPTRPNWHLVCPKDYCAGQQQQTSPKFNMDLQQLQVAWQTMIAKQPRITKVANNKDDTQMTYIQRSRLMHYPDTINVLLIPINMNKSTIAIYSASHYGYSDMGVNKQRIELWLSELSSY